MDFVNDFLKTYNDHLDEKVGIICQTIVHRIVFEQSKPQADREGMFTQKSLNILIQMTQNKSLMSKYSQDFEKLFMPIFEFMVDPSKITFEDSILTIIKNFIKRT